MRAPSAGSEEATRAEAAIDEVLAESFPASDAPPWTLGLDPHSVYTTGGSQERDATRSPEPRLGPGEQMAASPEGD